MAYSSSLGGGRIEARVAGRDGRPDRWHGSLVTFASDRAPFTEVDLDEARERLGRLADVYTYRLEALGPQSWDEPRGSEWTIRRIVEHVASAWYAEQVGDLRPASSGTPR